MAVLKKRQREKISDDNITLADIINRLKEIELKPISLSQNSLSQKIPLEGISAQAADILRNAIKKSAEDSVEIEDKDKSQSESSGEASGGYGTTRAGAYGGSALLSYLNYEKLFSHIGAFRAGGSYGSEASSASDTSHHEKGFFIDKESMNEGIRALKYKSGALLSDGLSSVPMGGMSSSDWELFKIWRVVEPVMYNLKMKTV